MKHSISLIVAATALALSLAACEEQDGPTEEIGESLDQSVDEMGDSLEEAGDNLD